MPDKVLGFEKMKTMDRIVDETEFKNRAYRAVIEEFERLEYHGVYKGNAHHLTQRAVDMLWVEFGVEKRDTPRDQIHDVMLEELLRRLKAMNWDALDEQTLFAIWQIIVKGGKW